MNLRNGTKPHIFDRRDYSFHRSKPVFAAAAPLILDPAVYNYDRGLTMYNQNIATPPYYNRSLFFGCTGMTSTDICTDQDGNLYSPEYTYDQTCIMEGHEANQGCDIRNSLKSLKVFPPRVPGQTNLEAMKNRRGQYLNIDRVPGRDWFDSFRIALRANAATRTGISMGVPWFKSWETTAPNDGRMRTPTISEVQRVKENVNAFAWHNVKISGEKVIDGEDVLCIKSWQGPYVGDKGWLYMNRECFNAAFDIWGTYAGCPGDVNPQDIERIRGELYQQLWDFVARLLRIFSVQIKVYA